MDLHNVDLLKAVDLILNISVLILVLRLTRSYARVELKVDTIWDWFISSDTKGK